MLEKLTESVRRVVFFSRYEAVMYGASKKGNFKSSGFFVLWEVHVKIKLITMTKRTILMGLLPNSQILLPEPVQGLKFGLNKGSLRQAQAIFIDLVTVPLN